MKATKKYKENFQGMWDAITQQGGSVTNHPGLIEARALKIAAMNERNTPNGGDTTLATTNVQDETKACFMLSGAHNLRHKALKDHLENAFTLEDNKYSLNTTDLLSMMNIFRVSNGKPRERPPTINDNTYNSRNFLQ